MEILFLQAGFDQPGEIQREGEIILNHKVKVPPQRRVAEVATKFKIKE